MIPMETIFGDDEKEGGDSNDPDNSMLVLLIWKLTTDDDDAEYGWTLEHMMAKDAAGSRVFGQSYQFRDSQSEGAACAGRLCSTTIQKFLTHLHNQQWIQKITFQFILTTISYVSPKS